MPDPDYSDHSACDHHLARICYVFGEQWFENPDSEKQER